MSTTAEKLAYLSETKAQIRDAIIAKGVDVPEGIVFRDYASMIKEIRTETPLPQLNNPAMPEQIYSGYEAIDQAGGMIVGIARTYDDGYAAGYTDGSGGVGPPQPLSYIWDGDSLTLTITEV